jgi:hypothetical protein
MRRAANRTLLWALAVSLLLHFLLVGSAGRFWVMPAEPMGIPIEARLATQKANQPPPHKPAPLPHKSLRPVKPVEQAPPPVLPEPVAAPPESNPPEVVTPPVAPELPSVEKLPPAPPARPVLRELPANMVLDYAVQMGDGDNGFVAGRASYIWHSSQGKYSMVSTVQATGLAAIVVLGRIVQVSQGRVNEGGLQPEQYWLERSGKQQNTARFDWRMNQLMLSGSQSSQPLQGQAQDLLSFPFQLALTVREGEPDFDLWVTNGSHFRDYRFHVIGHETISQPNGQMDALHLQGTRMGEGTLDVWLDLAKSGLPVRILTRDQNGKAMMLRLEGGLSPSDKPSGG